MEAAVNVDDHSDLNKEFAQWLADAFKEVDWPIPAYLQLGGFLSPLAKAIKDAPQEKKLEVVHDHLLQAYSPGYLASMFLERYSKVVYVRDFSRQIDDSLRTYFCGYTYNAVTGLLPVVEGIIRKMAKRQNRDVGSGTYGIKLELQALVDREKTSPYCYGERLVMLEAFRDFMNGKLFERTDRYDGFNEFNRHGILHGIFEDFGQDINFLRLVTLLDLLCFSIGLIEGGVSMFAPAESPESTVLEATYLQLQLLHRSLERQ